MNELHTFQWIGCNAMYLDQVHLETCGPVIIGRYGGCTAAGADKNEDASLVWHMPDAWTLAVLLDAHASCESAVLVLEHMAQYQDQIVSILNGPASEALPAIQAFFPTIWQDADFQNQCAQVDGETACLICIHKPPFLWWLSVGDNLVYLFHPELASLGQFALNQRMFYEWIGRANSMALSVPCYASGTRELRQGFHQVVMTTDGLFVDTEQETLRHLTEQFLPYEKTIIDSVHHMLDHVHQQRGRDSATMIAWAIDNDLPGLMPNG